MSTLAAIRETLRDGLSVDGAIVRGLPDSDIAQLGWGRRKAFTIKNADYVDHVMHGPVERYHKSIEYELMRSVIGVSLLTDEDQSWRTHRMMLNPVMAKRHLKVFSELMITPIEAYVDGLETSGRDEVEMAEEMVGLTLDVVGSALFGRPLGDFSREIKPAVTRGLRGAEFSARLLMVASPTKWVIRLAGWLLHHFPTNLPQPLGGLRWVMRTVDDTVWDVIRTRQQEGGSEEDLLGLLLSVRDENGEPLPMKRIRDEAVTFMLAGHETTANALAWMWYLLARNPGARERMLAEVDEALGSARPTLDDVARLPWTTACFQEAMRLYPPAWVIPRRCVRGDVIDGHRIPKGSTVIIPVNTLHHDERYWPDPDTYDPTRFMPENARSHHRSAYLPFGGGPRVCIGSSFALIEATLITAMMSRRFVFDLVPDHPVVREATLTLRPRHGVRMTVRRRSSDQARLAA